MDKVKIFHLNNNKYYIFLEKYKDIVETKIKSNFLTIKKIEEPIIKNNQNNQNNLSINEWEKMETLLQMAKHGFNKVYGWRFTDIHISIKNLDLVKTLINDNYNFLKSHNINTEWSKLLDISIENEKKRHAKTTCFLCCKKGHFAIDCKEEYDIDGECIRCESIISESNIYIKKKYKKKSNTPQKISNKYYSTRKENKKK